MRRAIQTLRGITLLLVLILMPRASALAVEAELPAILEPLSWSITDAKVRELFPDADIQRVGYTGLSEENRVITIISELRWERFGEAVVHIDRVKSGDIGHIAVMTTEIREKCFEGFPLPPWCRTSYGEELLEILEALKKKLVGQYGPPEEFPGSGARQADGLPPDEREITYRWKLDGFNLFLTLTVGEDDYWQVEIQAVRNP